MLVVGSLSVNRMAVNLAVENPDTEDRTTLARCPETSHDPHEDCSNAAANSIVAAELGSKTAALKDTAFTTRITGVTQLCDPCPCTP